MQIFKGHHNDSSALGRNLQTPNFNCLSDYKVSDGRIINETFFVDEGYQMPEIKLMNQHQQTGAEIIRSSPFSYSGKVQ